MLDDFWGEAQWENMASELKKAFPERTFTDLPLNHPIYHCVFEIKAKGQVQRAASGCRASSIRSIARGKTTALTARPCITAGSSTTKAGSWSLRRTTPTTATAGNARARAELLLSQFLGKNRLSAGH